MLLQEHDPIGFLGLGHMGLPIAQRLLTHGYRLCVFDPNPLRTTGWQDHPQVEVVSQMAEVATPGGVVFSMVPDDAALRQVVDALCPHLGTGLHLSLSTVAPATARWAAHRYAEANTGTCFLSAPVLGRPNLAESGTLTIFLSGNRFAKAWALPLLTPLGTVHDVGEAIETGPVLKLAANSLVVAALEAMAQAASFLRAHGLDAAQGLPLLAETPLFAGAIYREYGAMIGSEQYTPAWFPVPLGLKDVSLMLESAAEQQCPMPSAHLAYEHLQQAQQAGWESLDWSVLARVVEQARLARDAHEMRAEESRQA